MHTYEAIAENFSLWSEYVDTQGVMTEQEFDALTIAEKVQIQVETFGPEKSCANEQ